MYACMHVCMHACTSPPLSSSSASHTLTHTLAHTPAYAPTHPPAYAPAHPRRCIRRRLWALLTAVGRLLRHALRHDAHTLRPWRAGDICPRVARPSLLRSAHGDLTYTLEAAGVHVYMAPMHMGLHTRRSAYGDLPSHTLGCRRPSRSPSSSSTSRRCILSRSDLGSPPMPSRLSSQSSHY